MCGKDVLEMGRCNCLLQWRKVKQNVGERSIEEN